MGDDLKTSAVPRYNGKNGVPASLCLLQLEAHLTMKGLEETIDPTFQLQLPATCLTQLDPNNAGEAAQEEAKKKNTKAMAAVTMGINAVKCLKHLKHGRTAAYPKGLAWKVVESIRNAVQKQDAIRNIELKKEIAGISMADDEDPETLFDQIDSVKLKHEREDDPTTNMPEEDFSAQVMIAAAPQHASTVTNQIERRADQNQQPSIEDLQIALQRRWRLHEGKEGKSQVEDDGEVTLAATTTGFSGYCGECGKCGHKADVCRSRKTNKTKPRRSGGKFRGKCHLCGKAGHIRDNCFELDKNASKRPRGWKSSLGGKAANIATDDDGEVDDQFEEEFMLLGIDAAEVGDEFALLGVDELDDNEEEEDVECLIGDLDEETYDVVEDSEGQVAQDHLHAGEVDGTDNMGNTRGIEVRAVQAFEEDVGRGIIRINMNVRRSVGADIGDDVHVSNGLGSAIWLTADYADRGSAAVRLGRIDERSRLALGVGPLQSMFLKARDDDALTDCDKATATQAKEQHDECCRPRRQELNLVSIDSSINENEDGESIGDTAASTDSEMPPLMPRTGTESVSSSESDSVPSLVSYPYSNSSDDSSSSYEGPPRFRRWDSSSTISTVASAESSVSDVSDISDLSNDDFEEEFEDQQDDNSEDDDMAVMMELFESLNMPYGQFDVADRCTTQADLSKWINGVCWTCGQQGHAFCRMKQLSTVEEEQEDNESKLSSPGLEENNLQETSCSSLKLSFSDDPSLLQHKETWIGDAAATVDSTNSCTGMTNTVEAGRNQGIAGMNGRNEPAAKIGDMPGAFYNRHGEPQLSATMKRVRSLPTGACNLFSITKRTLEGYVAIADKNGITLTKGDKKIAFDMPVHTNEGMIWCAYFKRNLDDSEDSQVDELIAIATDKTPKYTLTMAHSMLAHANEDDTRKTAKQLGWKLVPGSILCEACSAGKAKQKNVPKKTSPKATGSKDELEMHLDISTVKARKGDKKPTQPVWVMLVDGRTNLEMVCIPQEQGRYGNSNASTLSEV